MRSIQFAGLALWVALGATGAPALAQAVGTVGLEVDIVPVPQGDAAVLTVRCACELAGVTVLGRPLRAELPLFAGADGEWQGLLGVDVDTAPGSYTLSIRANRRGGAALSLQHPLVVTRKQFDTRTLTVEPRFVEPPPDVQARIVREAERLNAIYATATPLAGFVSMRVPLETAVTGVFGSRSVFNGQPRSPHVGVDFRGSVGTAIGAPAAGTIVLADDLYFTGNTVVIDHGQGIHSILAHMSVIGVTDGAHVAEGDVVGKVGATGRVTGPHLHWSIRLLGSRVNPLSVVEALTAATRP